MHSTAPYALSSCDQEAFAPAGRDLPSVPPSLATLLTRRSVGPRHLDHPAPGDAHLTMMALAALRAPDHGELVPYRFAVVEPDAVDSLAALFGEAARAEGASPHTVAAEMERAKRAPLTVVVVANLSVERAIPAHEQWMAIGGAVTNFLNAAHALGFAGKMLSGRKVTDPQIARAICHDGETLVGWIVLGTRSSAEGWTPPKPRHPYSILSKWPSAPLEDAHPRACA